MRLMIGGLIHDRGEVTQCYLRHLKSLDVSGHEVSYFFVADVHHYEDFYKLQVELPGWFIALRDAGPHYCRKPSDPERTDFRRLAFLRNLLRERVLMEKVDALISIDSDICVPADLVQQMAAVNYHWTAALVDNSALRDLKNDQDLVRMRGGERHYNRPAFNVMNFTKEEQVERICPDLVNGGEVEYTGAICWYSSHLLERAWWGWHKSSEDGGFSLMARSVGFRARYLPVICDHLMSEERLQAHKENCALCQG